MKTKRFLTEITIIVMLGVIVNWLIFFEHKLGYINYIEMWIIGNLEMWSVAIGLMLFVKHNFKRLKG